MIKNTVEKIEVSIKKIKKLDHKKKAELVRLLGKLKTEVEALSKTHGEQAESIAGFAELAAHETARKDREEDLRQHSVEGLSLSVKGFETSHPKLTSLVNDICNLLAGIGI